MLAQYIPTQHAQEQVAQLIDEPLFEPTFLNLEYIFSLIFGIISNIFLFLVGLLSRIGLEELSLLRDILLILSLLIASAIIYIAWRYYSLRKDEDEKYGEVLVATKQELEATRHNLRWKKVVDLSSSLNEADWRVAIIEADAMLEDMVEAMGYHGITLGDRLKAIEQSDFRTLQFAWEAHKVRNKIAHQGSSFVLIKREVDRVIGLYEQVFHEFHNI